MIICIDAAHTLRYNSGACKDYHEGSIMYRLAKMMKEHLESFGQTVVLTREKLDDDPSLKERADIAIRNNADLLISLHTGYDSSNPGRNEITVYGSISTQQHDQLGVLLADEIERTVFPVPVFNTRVYHKSQDKKDYYGLLRCATVVGSSVKAAFIIEHGCHTNPEMCEWLCGYNNLSLLAEREARIIAQYCASDGGWYQDFDVHYTQYRVNKGDSWSRIAKQTLGNGSRNKELMRYNDCKEGYKLVPGHIIKIPKHLVRTDDKTIIAGKKYVRGTLTLTIPVRSDVMAGPPPAPPVINPPTNNPPYRSYRIEKGDSWWSIAHKQMGTSAKCRELAKFNGMKTTSRLRPGDILRIPNENTVGYRVYTALKGDTWWRIAKEQMGSGSKYTRLAQYNGKRTTDPITPGQIVHIPM